MHYYCKKMGGGGSNRLKILNCDIIPLIRSEYGFEFTEIFDFEGHSSLWPQAAQKHTNRIKGTVSSD
jgi:hypothetical protein